MIKYSLVTFLKKKHTMFILYLFVLMKRNQFVDKKKETKSILIIKFFNLININITL